MQLCSFLALFYVSLLCGGKLLYLLTEAKVQRNFNMQVTEGAYTGKNIASGYMPLKLLLVEIIWRRILLD